MKVAPTGTPANTRDCRNCAHAFAANTTDDGKNRFPAFICRWAPPPPVVVPLPMWCHRLVTDMIDRSGACSVIGQEDVDAMQDCPAWQRKVQN